MAFSHLSYTGLLAGMLLVMVTFRFVAAAYWGLIALVGQEKLMSGAPQRPLEHRQQPARDRRGGSVRLHRRLPQTQPDLHAHRRHDSAHRPDGAVAAARGIR